MSCFISVRDVTWQDNELEVAVVTLSDVPSHMWMRISRKHPWIHKKPSLRRGIQFAEDVRFCFTVYEDIEQDEPGDTLTHTFELFDWPVCESRWFYFWGTQSGEVCHSTTAIFTVHRETKDVIEFVRSIGKFGEVEYLINHVKLTPGVGVTITRDDLNNAYIIAAPAAPPAAYEGFGDTWNQYKSDGLPISGLGWNFDEVYYNISTVGTDVRLWTNPMRTWGLDSPHTCEFAVTRGVTGAGSPYHWFCIVMSTPDIHNNLNQQHIGWRIGSNDSIYATNANGVARTQTGPYGIAWPPRFLKWVRSAADIKFYVDNVLVATHTTNLPTVTNSCIFTMQSIANSSSVRAVYMTQPHYRVN